ncbi:hypothetical protein GGX14DRAFT_382681 [Mycena pura]|uniref:Uncharacterized protein n=1 Tax=Mycena pura TaxID=153505 RepID=A0AAD6ULL6_9AGAR|nr:hypothetical protein GGX14DRAFT_382681 [Mycena pura]
MSESSTANGPGPLPARLLFDPNLETCPDFASDDYLLARQTMVNLSEAEAIETLKLSWTAAHDRRKGLWAAQEAADRATEEAAAANQRAAAAEEARRAEEELLELEKKKPKLGAFDLTAPPPSFVESPISAWAQKRLDEKKYVPLHPFSPLGLREAAAARLSSADDASTIKLTRNADDELSVQAGPSASAHKNMPRDSELSWNHFSLAHNRYTRELQNAGWPQTHIQIQTMFFHNLETHPFRERKHGQKILLTYADRMRRLWFDRLGTSRSFNLEIITKEALAEITDEVLHEIRTESGGTQGCVFNTASVVRR